MANIMELLLKAAFFDKYFFFNNETQVATLQTNLK
jgi:hypothetical protein